MPHNHNHQSDNLRLAFFLNLGFAVIELFGGIAVNSISIISDAMHDLGDSLALGLAWYLENKSKQEANENFSFGYSRFSLLGALINSLLLIAGSGFVIYFAIQRIKNPETSDALGMIGFAILGIIVNGYAAWRMSSSSGLNQKVATLHLMEDVLNWIAVLSAAIIMYFTDNEYIDPILSLIITAIILWNVFKRLNETLYIFLQGVPKGIDLKKIILNILQIEHVESVHHTHIWSLDGEHHVFTSHLVLRDIHNANQLFEAKQLVAKSLEPYQFNHITIETELNNSNCSLLSNLENFNTEEQ